MFAIKLVKYSLNCFKVNESSDYSQGIYQHLTVCKASSHHLPFLLPEILIPAKLLEVRSAFKSLNFCTVPCTSSFKVILCMHLVTSL